MSGSLEDPGGCAGLRDGSAHCWALCRLLADGFGDISCTGARAHLALLSLCFGEGQDQGHTPNIAAEPDKPSRACAAAQGPNQS